MNSKKEPKNSKPSSRRRFLKQGAALAGLVAAGGIRSARGQFGQAGTAGPVSVVAGENGAPPPRRANDRGGPVEPSTVKTSFFSLLSPLQDQFGTITPNGLFFVDEHGPVPEVDPRRHRLTIFGMVDRPLTFTMEELMDMPSVCRMHTVECNSNGTPGHRNRLLPW